MGGARPVAEKSTIAALRKAQLCSLCPLQVLVISQCDVQLPDAVRRMAHLQRLVSQ
jgi:hypothetical protein